MDGRGYTNFQGSFGFLLTNDHVDGAEDEKLKAVVQKEGTGDWDTKASQVFNNSRTGSA